MRKGETLKRNTLVFLCAVGIAVFSQAQTTGGGGALLDSQLDTIQQTLTALEAQVDSLIADPETIAAINARIDALQAQVDTLGSSGTPPPLCVKCNDVTIENLEKGFAWHYLRIKMLEYDLDPTGNANQCWDTGGIFDLDVFSCVCPPESTWTTNTRTDGGTDAGCYLIDPSAGSGSPTPKSLSSPTPNPIAALDPAKSFVMREQYASSARYSAKRILPPRCEPAAENVPPDDFCSWDATSCDWSCDETVHALPKESSR